MEEAGPDTTAESGAAEGGALDAGTRESGGPVSPADAAAPDGEGADDDVSAPSDVAVRPPPTVADAFAPDAAADAVPEASASSDTGPNTADATSSTDAVGPPGNGKDASDVEGAGTNAVQKGAECGVAGPAGRGWGGAGPLLVLAIALGARRRRRY
jgi:hypothetical protein